MATMLFGQFIFRDDESDQAKKDKAQEEMSSGLDYDLPDVLNTLSGLEGSRVEALQFEHREETKEIEKQGKGELKKRQQQRPKGGTVCCCYDPSCSIGPFITREGGA